MEWARSKTIGRVTEVTLFTPIRQGFVPGERRTYEQQLAMALQSVQQRVLDGIPTPINGMPTIHFARWLILRPGIKFEKMNVEPPTPEGALSKPLIPFESRPIGKDISWGGRPYRAAEPSV